MHVKISGDGLIVDSVAPHYPAAKAGVQAGSQLTAIDGTPLQSLGDLRRATAGVQPGRHRPLHLPAGRRQGHPHRRGSRDARAGIIGIGIAEQLRISHLPVHVRFLTQGIGGPSAGLAFTLEIYDALSGRHLLHGHRIAVTGKIALNGAVGPIGGVTQKTLGVIDGRRRHLHRAPRGRQLPRRGGRSAWPDPDHRCVLFHTSAARYPAAAAVAPRGEIASPAISGCFYLDNGLRAARDDSIHCARSVTWQRPRGGLTGGIESAQRYL